MPKGSKLDSCHEKVKKSLIKEGKSENDADRIAWAVCKEQERNRKKEADTKEREKNLAKIQKEKKKKRNSSSDIKNLKKW